MAKSRTKRTEQFSCATAAQEANPAIEPQEIKTTRLGKHYLYQGDCRQVLSSATFPTVDLVIADPPYWKVVGEKWDYQWRTEEDYIEWSRLWLSDVYSKLRIGGSFYLFGYFGC